MASSPAAPPHSFIETSSPLMAPAQSPDPPLILNLSLLLQPVRRGVTRTMAALHAEAVTLCFSEAGHPQPVNFHWVGSRNRQCVVEWTEPGPETSCAYDPKVATEWAACGLAILVVEVYGYVILEKSYSPSGFDYWIGTPDLAGDLFQKKARLEVSGIRAGNHQTRFARLNAKIRQVNVLGYDTLPAMIVIVEFGTPTALICER